MAKSAWPALACHPAGAHAAERPARLANFPWHCDVAALLDGRDPLFVCRTGAVTVPAQAPIGCGTREPIRSASNGSAGERQLEQQP